MGRSAARFLIAASVAAAGFFLVGSPAHAQYPPSGAECGTFSGAGAGTSVLSAGVLFTVACTDLPPGTSADVFFIQSTTLLGTEDVDADGDFTFTGRIPSGARPGPAAIRVEADGESVTIPITIRGRVGAVLPTTGADVAGLGTWGAALFAIGYVLVSASRRRLAPARNAPITFIFPEPGRAFEPEPVMFRRATSAPSPTPTRGEYAPERHLCEADILDLPG